MYQLSMIVPIYNTEKQLHKCLHSLVSQTQSKPDIEILLINDGSTDGSEEIIKEYMRKYPTVFTYYSKQNTGVADTRNFGITKAQGEYICFVDADDYIEFDMIQNLEKYMQANIDIIKYKLQRVTEQGKIIEKIGGPIFGKVTGEEAFNLLAFSDVLIDSPCVYLFKKELFTKYNLMFKVGTEHEDFGLIPLVLLKAKTVVSTDQYGYYYVQSQDSITRNIAYEKTRKRIEDTLKHYDHMIAFLEEQDNLLELTKKNVKTYYTNAILLKLKELKKEDLDTYIHEIKQRNMIENIQVRHLKQWIKKWILWINIKWYLKLK